MLTRQINTLEKIRRCNDLDDNPLEINNMTGFANLFREFNKNNDVIKEYRQLKNLLITNYQTYSRWTGWASVSNSRKMET